MVECIAKLDEVFGCLADPTRRDILARVSNNELSVTDIAKPYEMSIAAVSKHLKVLAKAKLIAKRRQGKSIMITAQPRTLHDAKSYLDRYTQDWNDRLDNLAKYMEENP